MNVAFFRNIFGFCSIAALTSFFLKFEWRFPGKVGRIKNWAIIRRCEADRYVYVFFSENRDFSRQLNPKVKKAFDASCPWAHYCYH